jgi:CheY-like chemotaxis protein/predicted RNA-binding Zn-ribbon protein involved in translation (DUF1610 family)
MNCPRCKMPIGPLPGPDSIVTCPGCGARLMTRSAASRSQGGPKTPAQAVPLPPTSPSVPSPSPASAGAPSPDATISVTDLPPPSATLPPLAARLFGLRRPTAGDGPAEPKGGEAPVEEGKGTADTSDEEKTRPGRRKKPGSEKGGPAVATPGGEAAPPPGVDGQELLLAEVRAIRALQEEILSLLRRPPSTPGGAVDEAPATGRQPAVVSPIRAQQRRSVVLIDDDPSTREAAVEELRRAEVPVRAYDNGQAALAAIAEEKPDIIVLELALEGEMAAKDVINLIKATMEWVDIPLILWTRETVTNQREARQIHGADELVEKSAGAAALVARVITVFRRS